MALVDDTLYVADTENHQLRTVDLAKKEVVTLAGTGEAVSFRAPGGKLRATALNSPWDLCVRGRGYVHRDGRAAPDLGRTKLGSATIQQYAGSGREDITMAISIVERWPSRPGSSTTAHCSMSVDSEGSAVRRSRQIQTKSDHPTVTSDDTRETHDLRAVQLIPVR